MDFHLSIYDSKSVYGSLSTLKPHWMRKEILEYQHNFFKNARNEASKESEAIVFGDEKDAAKTYHLAEILKRHKLNFMN